MRIVDLIDKKKRKGTHTKEEIDFLIDSFMNGSASDYQISAWLMAVCFNGLNEEETTYLTKAMIDSGEVIDFGELTNEIIDKHSTGGVGDKLTLTVIPLLLACDVPVAKLSGRGLGHTGGTIDKLESIPGYDTELTTSRFISNVKKIGVAIASQTQDLTPADGKLYALRDVTATVDCMPLIASSVVSKKIASGAGNIILDVKYGSGAFMKTPQDAVKLSKLMVKIAKNLNKSIVAVITSMEEPLGRTVGNAIEVFEAIEFLKGKVKGDLAELSYDFAALALVQLGKFQEVEEAKTHLIEIVNSGAALNKFKEMIAAQGGDTKVIEDYSLLKLGRYITEIKSVTEGYIQKVDAHKIAKACKILGAGRDVKTDKIDSSVGIFLNKKYGEMCKFGDVLYTIYSSDKEKTKLAKELCNQAYEISEQQPEAKKLIHNVIR